MSCSRRCRRTTGRTRRSRTSLPARSRSASSRFTALRVTYVGELGYELHVPADQGASRVGGAGRGRRGVRAAAGRAARDVVAAAGEGLPRLRGRHREHRRPARRRARRSPSPGTSPAASSGATPCWPSAATAAPGWCRCALDDPEPLLHGGEPLLHDGEWVGYIRAGDFGHTLKTSVGLAVVEHADGVTGDWLPEAGSRSTWPARATRRRCRCAPSTTPIASASAAEQGPVSCDRQKA